MQGVKIKQEDHLIAEEQEEEVVDVVAIGLIVVATEGETEEEKIN